MILHCKDFTIDGYPVTMGHDRESGKRYLVQEININTIQELPYRLINTVANLEQIKAIFWIKDGIK